MAGADPLKVVLNHRHIAGFDEKLSQTGFLRQNHRKSLIFRLIQANPAFSTMFKTARPFSPKP